MKNLVTEDEIVAFIKAHTGTSISVADAHAFQVAIEGYVLRKAVAATSPLTPPYVIGPRSDSLSANQRSVLCDFENGRSRYRIFDVADAWIGRLISPGLHVEHTSAIFIRKEMWRLNVHGPADAYLSSIFEETCDLRPRECYDFEAFRRGIPRTVKAQLHEGRRYRIPKSPELRELRPFQLVHLPDDAGCFNVLPAELHLMKTFFSKHDEDISFGWNEDQSLWVLWTDWIRWVIDHTRRSDEVRNPTGRDYDAVGPST